MNQIEKLQHLKNIISKVPPSRLDLDTWRGVEGVTAQNFDELLASGAKACVIGWATADETFQKMNFGFHEELPVYIPYDINGLSKIKQGITAGFEYHYGTIAVEQFFGLYDDDAYNLIMDSAYQVFHPNEVLKRIDALIENLNHRPLTLDDLEQSSHLKLDLELQEFMLPDDEIREIKVVVSCLNDYFPDDAYLEFNAYINIPREEDPIGYIQTHFNENSPMAFVPCMNEMFDEYLEKHPIEELHEGWQEHFISPYDQHFNAKLTAITLQSISQAKCVI